MVEILWTVEIDCIFDFKYIVNFCYGQYEDFIQDLLKGELLNMDERTQTIIPWLKRI